MITRWKRYGWSVGLATILTTGLVGTAGLAVADDDSSADAPSGFDSVVAASKAVVIQVPVNEQGEELTSAASARLYSGVDDATADNLKAVYDASLDISGQRQLTASDISLDSSTSGWYRYNYNYGWYNGYYNNYQPYYYNYGSYNYYGYPTYYSNYYNPTGSYWGYRYYYYPYSYYR